MARDLRQVPASMFRLAKALERDVNDFVAQITIAVQYEVVRRTPVDVGTARSNFVVRVNAPFPFVYKAYSPFASRYKGGSGGSLSEAANLGRAVAQARGVMARRKTDDTVYITNNLPYIARLNRGYSRQAPRGYIRAGVSAGVSSVARTFKFSRLSRAL